MKERIHEHLSNELRQASRTDTTIVIIAIVVSFLLFGMALGFGFSTVSYNYDFLSESQDIKFNMYTTVAMFISLVAIIMVNWFSIRSLVNNKKQKIALAENLGKLSQEEGANQYYDSNVSKGYGMRSNLFIGVSATIAATLVIIPVIIFINQIVEKL
jgi:divalent metal cation (Fe/Co/Zn/Cd) transporter